LSKSLSLRGSSRLLLAGALLSAVTAGAQSTSTPDKLPPPPTIDPNVNKNETLTDVRYNNKYEIYGGAAFSHFKSGPLLTEGTNLGGFDVQGTRWFTGRLGATANLRGYYGTQGPAPNAFNVHGPLVYEHLFLGGATYRLLAREHAALDAHALAGGAYGVFDGGLSGSGAQPRDVGLYNNGGSFASAVGGSLELNRSPRLALRISPDWIMTRYGGYTTPTIVPSPRGSFAQNEFGVSVGILYRMGLGKGPRLR
jgi:hypothetical protein